MRRQLIALTAVLAPALVAHAATWNVTSGDWGTDGNWDTLLVPGAGETASVLNGGTATINDGNSYNVNQLLINHPAVGTTAGSTLDVLNGSLTINTWTRIANASAINVGVDGAFTGVNFAVGDASGGAGSVFNTSGTVNFSEPFRVGRAEAGTLSITGGTFTGSTASDHLYVGDGASLGTVNHSAGSVVARVSIAYTNSGNVGIYNLSGIAELDNLTRLEIGRTGSGEMNISGGQLWAPGNPTLLGGNGGYGELNISGGTVLLEAGLHVGHASNGGSGTLRVSGSEAVIKVGGASQGGLKLIGDNGNMLAFDIGLSGVSTIEIGINSPGASGTATLLVGTLDIGLLDGFVPALNQTFDLISTNSTYTGTTGGNFTNGYDINNLTLATEDLPFWSFGVITAVGADSETRNVLRLTYIPEPASAVLLGMVIPAVLARRRRGSEPVS